MQSHEIRIIGGHWKRSKLKVMHKPGLRPTPDRVRETLFNWLGQDMRGLCCVDVFAGTGALGFEAASRGADDILLIEQDAALAQQLQRMQSQLQALQVPARATPQRLRIQRGDGLDILRQLPVASQDVVFLDPPFDLDPGMYAAVLSAARSALCDHGAIYLEAPQTWNTAMLAPFGLVPYRHLKAGVVHAHLLHPVHTTPATMPATVHTA